MAFTPKTQKQAKSTLYQSDPVSDLYPHPECKTQPEHCPLAERVSRLERTAENHQKELGRGAIWMTRIEGNLERLAGSVDRLDNTLEKFQVQVEKRAEKAAEKAAEELRKGNKYGDMIVSSLIQWGIPLLGLAAIWAVVSSGAVKVLP